VSYGLFNGDEFNNWRRDENPPEDRAKRVIDVIARLMEDPTQVADQRNVPGKHQSYVWCPETNVVLTYRIAEAPVQAVILYKVEDLDGWGNPPASAQLPSD
jgi:hypothetical protein